MAKVIVIEDDKGLSEHIVDLLRFEKHSVDVTYDGDDAWERLQLYDYDLVILDWELPGMQGIDILKNYRARGGEKPVLLLTGRSKINEKIEGFESGADDFIPKPFDMRELQARIRVLLRRPQSIEKDVIEFRDLRLNRREFKCYREGKEIPLTTREFAILDLLVTNKGILYSADQLIDKIWTSEEEVSVEAVRQTIRRLRSKLDLPESKSYLTTKIGAGYKVDD